MKTSWHIKKVKNLSNSLNIKSEKDLFYLSSNGFIHNNDISIKIDNKNIEEESELAKTFNSHYINIVKSTTGKHPTKLGTLASRISEKKNCCNYHWQVRKSFEHYKYQKWISTKTAELNIKVPTVDQINNIKKATGPVKIPVKVKKMSAYIIDKHLTNIINDNLLRNSFLDSASFSSTNI